MQKDHRSFTGLDEVEVRLNVLAPPSKPLGPLEISGVTPNSCKLAWKKPADDGGSQVWTLTQRATAVLKLKALTPHGW